MADPYVPLDGHSIDERELKLPRAAALVRAVRADGSLASLVECRKTDSSEIVVFDVTVERPQVPVKDIRRVERIAVPFTETDDVTPEALALRDDFPSVPHLNQRDQEKPRSLCLYDRQWLELKPSWTAASLIERVRWWLAQTARDELHGQDQPLEPLMLSLGLDLVVPAKLGLPGGPSSQQVRVLLVEGKEGRVFVSDDPNGPNRGGMPSFVMFIETPTRTHGVIQRTPQTLEDLAHLVDHNGFQLVDRLRETLRSIPDDIRKDQARRQELRPIFVLGLPKTRTPGGAVERIELKGFLCSESIEKVGIALGAWVVHEGAIGQPLTLDDGIDGADVKIAVLNVVHELTWDRAAVQSGFDCRDARRIVAIGVGALGSQVAMNLARGGFGTWTLIDDDPFMPHNAVRHALGGGFVVGHNKAVCTAISMNLLARDEPTATAIPANLLKPGEYRTRVDEAISEAELLLDMSASVPVSRALADADLPCRAAAMFLSPEGTDLVLLTEDSNREIRLDDLEMLYYAEVATREDLAAHLDTRKGSMRYGTGCRDVSVLMPQTNVGALAGIGASGIMKHVAENNASACVWALDSDSLGVAAVDLAVSPLIKQEQHGWRVRLSRGMLANVCRSRCLRLPNETGGILVGGVDHERRCVHVLLALPSPPDSGEWPNMYIRGIRGLRQARDEIVSVTAGNLDYLGEWHSHTSHLATLPSADDRGVFRWISDLAAVDGRPPVMLIAGDNGARVFVAELDDDVLEVPWTP